MCITKATTINQENLELLHSNDSDSDRDNCG